MRTHHVVITGTGRAGTTALVKLLTVLGKKTGFHPQTWHHWIYDPAKAGLEFDGDLANAPYILKGPAYCDSLHDWLASGLVTIDHVIVATRDIYAAAESRRSVFRKTGNPVAPGGLWDSPRPEDQERVLTEKLARLRATIAEWNVPFTDLEYPRFLRDPQYLYDRLLRPFPDIPHAQFMAAFSSVVDASLIHDYRRGGA